MLSSFLLCLLATALARDPVPQAERAASLELGRLEAPGDTPCGPPSPSMVAHVDKARIRVAGRSVALTSGWLSPDARADLDATVSSWVVAAAGRAAAEIAEGCRERAPLWVLVDAHPDAPWATTAAVALSIQRAGGAPALRVVGPAQLSLPTAAPSTPQTTAALVALPRGLVATTDLATPRADTVPTLGCPLGCRSLDDIPTPDIDRALSQGGLDGRSPLAVPAAGASTALAARMADRSVRQGWAQVLAPLQETRAPEAFATRGGGVRAAPLGRRARLRVLPLHVVGEVLVHPDPSALEVDGILLDPRLPEVVRLDGERATETMRSLLPALSACVLELPPHWRPPTEALELRLVVGEDGAVVERRARTDLGSWPAPAVRCLGQAAEAQRWPKPQEGAVGLFAAQLLWGGLASERPLVELP